MGEVLEVNLLPFVAWFLREEGLAHCSIFSKPTLPGIWVNHRVLKPLWIDFTYERLLLM